MRYIGKNDIALSNIWNEEASMIEVCTVVHLISQVIVSEMKRVTEVDYNLDASYNVSAFDLQV